MEDQFLTFIQKPAAKYDSLDIQKLMLDVVKLGYSMDDFWKMPLQLVLQLLGLFEAPRKKAMSRKTLLANERRMNTRWGTVNGY